VGKFRTCLAPKFGGFRFTVKLSGVWSPILRNPAASYRSKVALLSTKLRSVGMAGFRVRNFVSFSSSPMLTKVRVTPFSFKVFKFSCLDHAFA